MTETAAWFDNALLDGLQMLVALHLPGAPPAETVEATAEVWIQVVWRAPVTWDESHDAWRLREAFISLARKADRWPAPKQLLDNLPQRRELPKLPAPPISAEQRRAYRERLRQALASFGLGGKSDGRR